MRRMTWRQLGLLFFALIWIGLAWRANASLATFSRIPSNSQPTPMEHSHLHGFVHEVVDGQMVCRHATMMEMLTINARTTDLPWRILRPPSSRKQSGLQLILRGTPQLDAFPQAKAAFLRAADTWAQLISTPITLMVDVDFGPTRFGVPYGPNQLGSTIPQVMLLSSGYSQIRSRLVAGASDGAEQLLYEALPVEVIPTDIGLTRDMTVATPILRAIGWLPPMADPAQELQLGAPPSIGFNSTFRFDFDPSDGIQPGTFDFDAIAVHEIGHVLGFLSNTGVRELSPSEPLSLTLWDLFRFRPGVTLQTFTTAARILSSGGQQNYFAGGPELGLSTGRPNRTGGDMQQASHWKADELTGQYIGVMDPTVAPGQRLTITANDLMALDSFGYQLASSPPPPTAPNIEVSPTSVDFGSVFLGQSLERAILVRNTGTAPLNVSPAVGSNIIAPVPPFSLVSPLSPFTVPAGGVQVVTVRFTPAIVDIHSGSLNLLTNDPDEAIVIVPLSGTGMRLGVPDIDVTPTMLDFGAVAIGQSAEQTLTVNNRGNAPLIITGLTLDHPAFSVTAPSVPFTIGPSNDQSISIVFRPLTSGVQTAVLSISSNDPDELTIAVPLIANATLIGLAEQEPNDSIATANLIRPNVNLLGTIGQSGDTDLFSFTVEAGQRLRVEVRARRLDPPSPVDTVLTLTNNRGLQLGQNDNIDDRLNDSRLDIRLATAGRYFLQVKSADPQAAGPDFRYEMIVIVTDSTFQEREANNDLDQANRITPDVLVAGAIDTAGDADFFSVSATPAQTLNIMILARSLAPSLPTDAVLTVFDANGQEHARAQASGLIRDASLSFRIPANGRYYIRVEQAGGAGGGATHLYFMRVTVTNQ